MGAMPGDPDSYTRNPAARIADLSADEPLVAAASEVTPARVANLGCRLLSNTRKLEVFLAAAKGSGRLPWRGTISCRAS